MPALEQGGTQLLHQTAATTFFARGNSALLLNLLLANSNEVFTELLPKNSAWSGYQHRLCQLLELKLRETKKNKQMGIEILSVGIAAVSTCNKSGEKPCAMIGRQTGATATTGHHPAPAAQPRRDGVLANLPPGKTTSQSTLGWKGLLLGKIIKKKK